MKYIKVVSESMTSSIVEPPYEIGYKLDEKSYKIYGTVGIFALRRSVEMIDYLLNRKEKYDSNFIILEGEGRKCKYQVKIIGEARELERFYTLGECKRRLESFIEFEFRQTILLDWFKPERVIG